MTLHEIRERIMFQTQNDAEDLGDYQPHIEGYINAGYDEMVFYLRGVHPEKLLVEADDEPEVPEWLHIALADYGTWMIYRNGNPVKQQRGMVYLSAFNDALARAKRLGGRAQFTGHLRA